MKPERLTKKKNGLFLTKQPFPEMINKLGQLEDYEEKLGVDLITFFKIFEKGFYYKAGNICYFTNSHWGWYICKDHFIVNDVKIYFKDYGVTWALTKEELE